MSIGMECACMNSSVKLHLEGALVHYIKDIRKDIVTFADAALEYKERNPKLSEHYLTLVKSQQDFIEELQKAKGVIKSLPECKES